MRKILFILTLACLIIVAAMGFLLKKGVSLRAATLITPSEISPGDNNVSHAVAYRLFPDLQRSDIMILGLPEGDSRMQVLAEQIALHAEQLLGQPLHRASNKMDLTNCPKLCWVTVLPNEAQELEKNAYIDNVIKPLNRSYFTLNLHGFEMYDEALVRSCESEKFLDYKCLVTLSIAEASRKMKDSSKRYFFMKRYEDRGNYLFIQK